MANRGPPGDGRSWLRVENRSYPWETTHWRMADSGRRCCVLYTTQPLASSPSRQDGLDDDDLEGSDHRLACRVERRLDIDRVSARRQVDLIGVPLDENRVTGARTV